MVACITKEMNELEDQANVGKKKVNKGSKEKEKVEKTLKEEKKVEKKVEDLEEMEGVTEMEVEA